MKDPRQKALDIYDNLGLEYKATYEKSGREVADRDLLLALRKHQMDLIDGGIYTAKELDDRVEKLQNELSSSGHTETASMEDIFHRWLNESAEAVQ